MNFDYAQASAYIEALTGEPVVTANMWFRCIHDADKTIAAHKYYGTLPDLWQTLCDYNSKGWGIFVNINAFVAPPAGVSARDCSHELNDVWFIRTQAADLDNEFTAAQNYALAAQSTCPPSFASNTSPGKYHLYWLTQPYQGNERYNALQRKIRQAYDGDKAVIDPTRVLRLPGFFNQKRSLPQSDKFDGSAPFLVTCHALPGFGNRPTVEVLEAAFNHINVIEVAGGRHPLGDPELAAPSLEWLTFGLNQLNPNDLDRSDWISVTSAFKQAGWSLTDENTLFNIWSDWCAKYGANDLGDNLKQWNSIRDTQLGWKSLKRRVPTLLAYERFGFEQTPVPSHVAAHANAAPAVAQPTQYAPPPTTQDTVVDNFADILSSDECKEYFKDCYFVSKEGKILTGKSRFMNATQFNGTYGGKLFIISPDGKTSDEPWKAATRSTLWTVPKIDHIRFVPTEPSYSILYDQLGRSGVNTYIPANIKRIQGDATPWLKHLEMILPVELDRNIFNTYIAHNVKYPGVKIPWAPLLQSAEGVGKGLIIEVIEFILGEMYVYRPPADQLVASGSTFNAWQRGKLMIIVDEIKVDERRELIEVLKPQITEKRIQVQSKGVDQEMEDNPANWIFFSNHKDAIPVNQNGRRYAIFYSAIQSVDDLMSRGMNDDYFTNLRFWLNNGGFEIVADWYFNHPIECNKIPFRAPETSSHAEAIQVSRGPIEVTILNAVEDGLSGFRGGYISLLAVMNRLRQLGGRQPLQSTVARILEQMGYNNIGRAPRAFSQENMNERTQVFALMKDMPVAMFGRLQGYE